MLHKSMINIQFDSSFALLYSPVFNSFLFGIFSAFGIYIYIYIYNMLEENWKRWWRLLKSSKRSYGVNNET